MAGLAENDVEERVIEIFLERIGLLSKLHYGTRALTERMFAELTEG